MRSIVFLVALSFTPAIEANIVQNPSFETGDLTGWSGSGWSVVTAGPPRPHWVTFPASCDPCPLFEDLATTAGVRYLLAFAYSSEAGADLRVLWDGTQIADIPGATSGWVQFSYSGLAVSRDGVTRLEFDGSFGSLSGLDDVTVDPQVPEPGSVSLVASGAVMLFLARRRAVVQREQSPTRLQFR